MASSPISWEPGPCAKAEEETKKIKGAETDVKTYALPTIPTKDYQQIVDEKIPVLTRDVNTAWKTLYDRQALLLTWPDTVQERFRKWGRKWPENEGTGKVTLAQVDYIAAYKDYVDMVYKVFKPFDYESGEGIVVAPQRGAARPGRVLHGTRAGPEQDLVRRGAALDPAHAAGGRGPGQQEREGLEWRDHPRDRADRSRQPRCPGSRSLAHSEALEEAPKILAPGETEEPAADTGGGGGFGGRGGGREMASSTMGMGRGGAANQDAAKRLLRKVRQRSAVQDPSRSDDRLDRTGSRSGFPGRTGKLSHGHPGDGFRNYNAARTSHQTRKGAHPQVATAEEWAKWA